MKTMIEYENLQKVNEPYIKDFNDAFNGVLNSGWFILGANVTEFEKEFAEYIGTDHCVGVASGLDALTISIMSLELPEKSEIIVPSNTYIATILSILLTNNRPVLVEPDISTYNINPGLIERSITSKTKAVMVVHLYGKTCDMDPIIDICKRHNLFLIEDCAQAHGAEYKGKKAGSFGDFAAYSFYPTKNLGCLGDGGAIMTNNYEFYKKSKSIRNYGSETKYYNDHIGLNSRLDEIQAAFLRIKLKDIDRIIEHKRKLANLYLTGLNNSYIKPVVEEKSKDVYHIFNIRHRKRDMLKKFLLDNGVKTEVHYPVAPHRQKALSFMTNLRFPLSEEIHETTLSLPVSVANTEYEILRVIEILNKFEE